MITFQLSACSLALDSLIYGPLTYMQICISSFSSNPYMLLVLQLHDVSVVHTACTVLSSQKFTVLSSQKFASFMYNYMALGQFCNKVKLYTLHHYYDVVILPLCIIYMYILLIYMYLQHDQNIIVSALFERPQ